MMVRTQFFTFMVHSTMAESVGKTVGLSVIPFDIHIMHKSEYSGLYGDYSSYSAEYDEIADAEEDAEDEE